MVAKKKAPVPASTVIKIPGISLVEADILIVGDSPLIMHRWSEKAKQEMLDKQMKKAKKGKEPKNPDADYAGAAYILDEQPGDRESMMAGDTSGLRFCFPAGAFKHSSVGACRYVDGAKMTEARGAYHIVGEYVEIISDAPIKREDAVKISMTTDLRYRPEFRNWRTTLKVRYNANALSLEQIMNLLNIAGFGVGVGEWRPEKNGSFGMFHVGTEGE